VIRRERRKIGSFDFTRTRCGELISNVEDLLENVRNPNPKDGG